MQPAGTRRFPPGLATKGYRSGCYVRGEGEVARQPQLLLEPYRIFVLPEKRRSRDSSPSRCRQREQPGKQYKEPHGTVARLSHRATGTQRWKMEDRRLKMEKRFAVPC